MGSCKVPDLSREEVQALLPWYAAGSLGADDSRRVADWLAREGANDSELLAELDWLRLTAQQVKSEAQARLPAANQGLETLMQRVRQEAVVQGTQAAPPAPAPQSRAAVDAVGHSPWQALWQWLRKASPQRSLGLAGLALAQAAVIVVLAQRPADAPDGGQTPLSDPRLPALADSVLLQVTFAPTATEAQVRAALQQARASLVAGPGTLGIYTVAVPRATAEASTAALRQQPGVVETVQTLPPR